MVRLSLLRQRIAALLGTSSSLVSPVSEVIDTAGAAGTPIVRLTDPFAGLDAGVTTHAVAGTVPPQLALDGATVVRGAARAVAGVIYRLTIVSRSGDGRSITRILTFIARGLDVDVPLPTPAPTPAPTPTPTPAPVPTLNALSLAAADLLENSAAGTVIGGILGLIAGSTPTVVTTHGSRFAVAGTNLVAGSVATDYEAAQSYQVTIRQNLAGATNDGLETILTVRVLNQSEQPNLQALSFVGIGELKVGTSASGAIAGATAGSTIAAAGLPAGFTINSVGRTWAYDGSGAAGTTAITLTEALGDSANSGRQSAINVTIGNDDAATIPAPSITITGTPRVNDINFVGSGSGLNPDDGLQFDHGAGWKTLTGSFQAIEGNTFALDENMPGAGSYQVRFRVIRLYENEVALDQPLYGSATAPITVEVSPAIVVPPPQYANQTAYRYYFVQYDTIANSQSPGAGYASLADLNVGETDVDANRVSAATLTASSTLGGYPVDNVKDGNANTFWHSGSNALPESIRLDFGLDPANWPKLNRLDLTSRGDNEPGQMPISGRFLGSHDGTVKTQVLEWAGADWAGAAQTMTFITAKS